MLSAKFSLPIHLIFSSHDMYVLSITHSFLHNVCPEQYLLSMPKCIDKGAYIAGFQGHRDSITTQMHYAFLFE